MEYMITSWNLLNYPINCVKSGNLKPWNVNGGAVRERAILCGGGLKSTGIPELPAAIGCCSCCCCWLPPFCNTRPHCALQTSSLNIVSRGHSRANWAQSVIRNDAHCAWNKNGVNNDPTGNLAWVSNTYTLICTNTTGTWRWERWFTNIHLLSTDLTSLNDILTPCA